MLSCICRASSEVKTHGHERIPCYGVHSGLRPSHTSSLSTPRSRRIPYKLTSSRIFIMRKGRKGKKLWLVEAVVMVTLGQLSMWSCLCTVLKITDQKFIARVCHAVQWSLPQPSKTFSTGIQAEPLSPLAPQDYCFHVHRITGERWGQWQARVGSACRLWNQFVASRVAPLCESDWWAGGMHEPAQSMSTLAKRGPSMQGSITSNPARCRSGPPPQALRSAPGNVFPMKNLPFLPNDVPSIAQTVLQGFRLLVCGNSEAGRGMNTTAPLSHAHVDVTLE